MNLDRGRRESVEEPEEEEGEEEEEEALLACRVAVDVRLRSRNGEGSVANVLLLLTRISMA
jgi:hypothetical protein